MVQTGCTRLVVSTLSPPVCFSVGEARWLLPTDRKQNPEHKINPSSAAPSLCTMLELSPARTGPEVMGELHLPLPLPAAPSSITHHQESWHGRSLGLSLPLGFTLSSIVAGSRAAAPSCHDTEPPPRMRLQLSALRDLFPEYVASHPHTRLSQAITCSDCSPSHVTA